jgi:large subunit ribosomal protein L4
MAKAPLYNLKNEKIGEIDLPSVFSTRWKPILVKQALMAQLANARRPWAHAKDRSEVSGGGKKPWRQKGTGRARHGSSRSPIWAGGGVAHGPRNTRDYTQKLNKKMRQGALASLLSLKLKEGGVTFVDKVELAAPKTKEMFAIAKHMFELKPRAKKVDALFVTLPTEKGIEKAVRNLIKAKGISADSLNIYDTMNFKRVVIDSRAVSQVAKLMGANK